MKNDIFVSYIKTINNLIRINTVHKKFSGGDVLPICARNENAPPHSHCYDDDTFNLFKSLSYFANRLNSITFILQFVWRFSILTKTVVDQSSRTRTLYGLIGIYTLHFKVYN